MSDATVKALMLAGCGLWFIAAPGFCREVTSERALLRRGGSAGRAQGKRPGTPVSAWRLGHGPDDGLFDFGPALVAGLVPQDCAASIWRIRWRSRRPAPRLSWRVESEERGQRQTAYRIRVASTRERWQPGEATCGIPGRWRAMRNAAGAVCGAAARVASGLLVVGQGLGPVGCGVRVERTRALDDGPVAAGGLAKRNGSARAIRRPLHTEPRDPVSAAGTALSQGIRGRRPVRCGACWCMARRWAWWNGT
jgi:hypothetical protein